MGTKKENLLCFLNSESQWRIVSSLKVSRNLVIQKLVTASDLCNFF